MKRVSSTFGKESIPSIDELFIELNKFIDINIDGFTDFLLEYHKINKNAGISLKSKIEQEDDITNPLVMFLNENTSLLYFQNQFKTIESNSTTDIGIFKKYTKIPFCFIEAKRLPTPMSTGRQETEYVCYKNSSKQGGIERFKTEKHAAKEKLINCMMIGYIQEENASHWYNQINCWIDDEIKTSSNNTISWSLKDKLIQDNSFSKSLVTKYNSSHSRISLAEIKLVHYWIDLN